MGSNLSKVKTFNTSNMTQITTGGYHFYQLHPECMKTFRNKNFENTWKDLGRRTIWIQDGEKHSWSYFYNATDFINMYGMYPTQFCSVIAYENVYDSNNREKLWQILRGKTIPTAIRNL